MGIFSVWRLPSVRYALGTGASAVASTATLRRPRTWRRASACIGSVRLLSRPARRRRTWRNPGAAPLLHAPDDQAMFKVIAQRYPRHRNAGTLVPAREIWQVVAFVRTLGRLAPQKIGGDPCAAETLRRQRRLRACHTVGGRGGAIGPDLSDIGARRSALSARSAARAGSRGSRGFSAGASCHAQRPPHHRRPPERRHFLHSDPRSVRALPIVFAKRS